MTDPTDPHASDPHRDLAGVLHDVSNALTVLLGWVAEARAPDATAESVHYALGIIEQRARIARDLARHAIGSPRFDSPRDVGAVISEVIQALRIEADRRGAHLSLNGSLSAKIGGALDLSQVLTNIVLNALAHAPQGSEVKVTLGLEDDRCSLVVSDEGPGVASVRKESIFQGDSMRPGGTGVGLRHSRELARAAGGDVELLASEPRAGARFKILWPRADAIPRPPMSVSRLADFEAVRILIVEDDAAVTQLLETVLDARGAEVTVAASPEEIRDALGAGPYDAILVDLSPIAADPAAAFASFRTACPEGSIVLITGSADALPDAIANEAVELVRKPFEVREVVNALSRKKRS